MDHDHSGFLGILPCFNRCQEAGGNGRGQYLHLGIHTQQNRLCCMHMYWQGDQAELLIDKIHLAVSSFSRMVGDTTLFLNCDWKSGATLLTVLSGRGMWIRKAWTELQIFLQGRQFTYVCFQLCIYLFVWSSALISGAYTSGYKYVSTVLQSCTINADLNSFNQH